jgi:hypothetical protein
MDVKKDIILVQDMIIFLYLLGNVELICTLPYSVIIDIECDGT